MSSCSSRTNQIFFLLFVAFILLRAEAAAITTSVTVSAKPQWTETPVLLNIGNTLSITASGSWRHDTCCGSLYGPDGDPLNPTNGNGFMTQIPGGTLIGAIAPTGKNDDYFKSLGQNHPDFFKVGSSLPFFQAPKSGKLYLGFNDYALPGNQPATNDNTGSVTASITVPAAKILFDDFTYDTPAHLNEVGIWNAVNQPSKPGKGTLPCPENPSDLTCADYRMGNVSFVTDHGSNKLLVLRARTDGFPANTTHSRIETPNMEFLEGIYVARIKFDNTRHFRDLSVQTFFTINGQPGDDYSESDFEYLPYDGWSGDGKLRMYMTTWENSLDNLSTSESGRLSGWHYLVLQIEPAKVIYSVYNDRGGLNFQHLHDQQKYFPENPMNISLASWLYDINPMRTREREYTMEVDWVYFSSETNLTVIDVINRVNEFRNTGVTKFMFGVAGVAFAASPVGENNACAHASPIAQNKASPQSVVGNCGGPGG